MGKRSGKRGKSPSPKIEVDAEGVSEAPVIDATGLSKYIDAKHVSVSLRYFQRSCECFSKWEKNELKKFSQTLDKIRGYSPEQLKLHKPLCDNHKGEPAERRFSIPSEISLDTPLHEIKVDPSNKLRMHGFFSGSVFFLLWLDREHACFPEK